MEFSALLTLVVAFVFGGECRHIGQRQRYMYDYMSPYHHHHYHHHQRHQQPLILRAYHGLNPYRRYGPHHTSFFHPSSPTGNFRNYNVPVKDSDNLETLKNGRNNIGNNSGGLNMSLQEESKHVGRSFGKSEDHTLDIPTFPQMKMDFPEMNFGTSSDMKMPDMNFGTFPEMNFGTFPEIKMPDMKMPDMTMPDTNFGTFPEMKMPEIPNFSEQSSTANGGSSVVNNTPTETKTVDKDGNIEVNVVSTDGQDAIAFASDGDGESNPTDMVDMEKEMAKMKAEMDNMMG